LKQVESVLPMITGPKNTRSNRMIASIIVYNNDKGCVGSIRSIPVEVPSGMIYELHQRKYKWSNATKDKIYNEELTAIKSALSLKEICLERQLKELKDRNVGLMLETLHTKSNVIDHHLKVLENLDLPSKGVDSSDTKKKIQKIHDFLFPELSSRSVTDDESSRQELRVGLDSELASVKHAIAEARESKKCSQQKLEKSIETLKSALEDEIALPSAIRITRGHSEDFLLAALKQPTVFGKLEEQIQESQANRCILLIVSRLEACNICVDRLYDLWSLINSKLSDKKCKVLVVSKMDIKNQSGTAKAGGYELSLVPSVNASTCAHSSVHIHNIVMKEEKKSKFKTFVEELKSFSSEVYSCFSWKEAKASRRIFESSNLWTVATELRQLYALFFFGGARETPVRDSSRVARDRVGEK
jgi:hypothetical protein